jgi:hypothetical protein
MIKKITVAEDKDIFTDDVIHVDDVSIDYVQSGDCNEDAGETQTLKVYTQNNGTDRYLVFSTERWAIDSIDDLVEILQDFKKRAGLR